MTTISDQNTERQYYIDWLRIILIISVFLFHIGMIFNTWPWHIKNTEQYGGLLKQVMSFLHFWRMPLLFMLSGAGTFFALGKRRPGQYLWERFKRLVIPLVIGIFTLVPVQVYIEKSSQYNSLLDYYPHMFNGIYPEGNFSWHHLWFIAYLFVISLFITPFLNFLRSRRFERFVQLIVPVVTKPLALNVFIIPLLISQIILRRYFETETNALVNDWASLTYYLIFFLSGFMLLPVRSIADTIGKYRLWYLAETVAAAIVVFRIGTLVKSEETANIIGDVSEIFLAWSCGITAIGFARQYLNKNSPFRKLANEAIYPFYLLHQPVIVVVGYFAVQLNIPAILKAILVLISASAISVTIYWFLIRPLNLMRVVFGMKTSGNKKRDEAVIIDIMSGMSEADKSLSVSQKDFKRKLAIN